MHMYVNSVVSKLNPQDSILKVGRIEAQVLSLEYLLLTFIIAVKLSGIPSGSKSIKTL